MIPAPPTEFELDGKEYRIGKLSAFQQFHVSRKIVPVLPPLIPVVTKVLSLNKDGKVDLMALPELLQPLADAMSAMPDEAAEYVMGTCLAALRRKDPESGNWVPVWNASAKVLMFSDLNDLSSTIGLVVRVVRESLGPFLNGLFGATPPETGATTA